MLWKGSTLTKMGSGEEKVWASTSQDLKVALSEYTPGKVLMIDGVEYEVNGLHFSFPPDPVDRAKHVFEDGESEALYLV